ncbi:carbohydrate kinase family protein [Jatrophihabitans sp. DSM 45814]
MVCVIGEAVIDLVPVHPAEPAGMTPPTYVAHPGGSPFNVAIGLARLGQQSQLQARLSADTFGRQLRRHAELNGVDTTLAITAAEHSSLAVVGLDANGNAAYDFYLAGTADWQWTEGELALTPPDCVWLHTGSLAAWTAPGAAAVQAHLERVRDQGSTIISYDPNIRPLLMGARAVAVAAVERSVAVAHVVKASAEDLAWLYPGQDVDKVVRAWLRLGPSLVVVTDGGAGAYAATTSSELISVDARPVAVVDTVGAGDAFMAGLINASIRSAINLSALNADHSAAISAILEEAILVAALTCGRAGADPPTADELAKARAAPALDG